MRRALLTASVKTPIVFGPSLAAGSSQLTTGYFFVQGGYTSPIDGTITNVSYYTTTSGTLWIYTGTLIGTTFTIRNRVSISTGTSGIQSASVSLGVLTGDCLAFWDTPSLVGLLDSGGLTVNYAAAGVVPVSGGMTVSTTGAYTVYAQASV